MTAATVMPMHPRILERREAVEDEYLQHRNRRLAGLLAFVMFAAMVWSAVMHSSLFDVDEVRVIGASTTLANEIRLESGIESGVALLRVEATEAESRISELPGVAEVAISRAWNGVVTVDVVERFAVAEVFANEGIARIGNDGIIVDVRSARDSQSVALPVVNGPRIAAVEGEMVPGTLEDAVAIAAGLPVDLAATIEDINVVADGVSLRLTGGSSAYLGDARQLETKFDALRAFLSQVDLRCLEEIDLQSPLVPVVRRSAC